MSAQVQLRRSFDQDAFRRGLELLSDGIARSNVLVRFRPIDMVASGGFVSVMALRNRPASQDLDYFLNAGSYGNWYETVRSHLKQLIEQVGHHLRYDSKWANDDVRMFLLLLNDPESLFERSKQQGVLLYRDNNLRIYAVLWEWVLVRKLKRLQMEGQVQRKEDWNDCVAVTKLLYDRNGCGLQREILTSFDDTEREPPVFEATVASLRRLVMHFYHVDPFPDPDDDNEEDEENEEDEDNEEDSE